MVLRRIQSKEPDGDAAGEDVVVNENQRPKGAKSPVYTQVVEIVDDEKTDMPRDETPARAPAAESAEPDDADIPLSSMKLPVDSRAVVGGVADMPYAKPEPLPGPAAAPPPTSLPETPQETEEKEVVSELFQPETAVGYPEISEHKRSPSRSLAIWAIVVIAVAAAIGAVIVFFSQGSVTVSSVSIAPAASPAPLPPEDTAAPSTVSPTPAVTAAPLDKSDLSVQVQNGGGVKGAASKMKALLEEKGYTVSDVGNAAEYTYEKTEIYVKANKEAYLDLLVNDLKGDYTIGKQEATLEDNVPYDARVIVGKE